MAQRRGPSIREVAEAAGVSPTTVSFVVNDVDNGKVSAATRDHVQKVVEQLGYRPNAVARGLRRQRTETIGFLSDRIATTPYGGDMIHGAQEAAWQHGMLLLLVNSEHDVAVERRALEMMADRRVDGLIYGSMYHRAVELPSGIEMPTVLLDCFDSEGRYSSVVPDEERGGYEATRHLLDHGHRAIGFINNHEAIPAADLRRRGYERALQEAGIEPDGGLIVDREAGARGGRDAARSLLDVDDRPTALFCFNDRVAMGAYQAAAELGLRVPDDLSIVGFDDQRVISEALDGGLTTMALPHARMGRWAVDQLLATISADDREPQPAHAREHCPIVIRDSVRQGPFADDSPPRHRADP